MLVPPFLRFTLFALLSLITLKGFGQVYETFDDIDAPDFSTFIINEFIINNGLCTSENALSGKAVRLNNEPSSLECVGFFSSGINGGVGVISFQYRSWSSDSSAQYNVEVNVNNSGYVNIGSPINTTSTTYSLWEYSLNNPSNNIKVRVVRVSGESLLIDNFSLTSIADACTGEPAAQATNITYSENPPTSENVGWTAGTGGDGYILVAREGSPVNFTPADGTDYSADTGGGNFETATDQGSGNKILYSGTSTSVTVNGLVSGSTYYFQTFAVCTNDNFNYLSGSGVDNDGTIGYTVPLYIPDDGCDSNANLESSYTFSGISPIGDVNVFVSITHPYREDLQIELESPNGTIVQLLNGLAGGSADNLEVNFDDEAVSTISDADHDINGIADQIVMSTIDLLSDFDGEDPNGTWTLRICDDDGNNIGVLNDWLLDISTLLIAPEPTNHPTNFGCLTVNSNDINLTWNDAAGAQVPDGYLIRWSDVSIASISNPIDGVVVPNSSTAQNVASGDEAFAVTGLDQDADYYFKIFPFTNSGSNIDYKTNGTIQSTSCTTASGQCGFETFLIPSVNSSYTDGSFITNEITWNYIQSRVQNTFYINGQGLMLKSQSDGSRVFSSAVPNGIVGFTCNLLKGFEGSGICEVELRINGLLVATSIAWDNEMIQTFTVPGINVSGDVVVEIRNSTSNPVVIDNIRWYCYSECTPTHTIASFYPIEGPAQTKVSIIGTDFTAASDVQFGGVSATSFTVVNDTLIKAKVSNNGLTGKITVIVASCEKQSVSDFNILEDNGSCGIGGTGISFATDIFISEVYDASSGGLSYIELFNGTENSIDLGSGNYSIRVETGATSNYILSGILTSGNTFILRLGNGSSECTGFTIQDDRPDAQGFNGNDEVSLYKNGILLDYVPNPNNVNAGGNGSEAPGFSQSRNSNVINPSIIYTAIEWAISNAENCNNLSVAPYVLGSANITINMHPADVNCSEVTFTVNATSTVNDSTFLPVTHIWRYVAPGDLTWSLVSSLNNTNGLTVVGAGTPTITIGGSTSQLLNYQFYVDMGTGDTGQCRKFSNAASYYFDTKAFYRTTSSGNWGNSNNWEMSDTEIGVYTSACQYPIAKTSDKIIIRNGHNINFDVELSADWIEICTTCTLELGTNDKLTMLDGNSSGSDLIVNGTLIDKGNSANGTKFFNDIPTWEIGGSGTLIITNSSFATRYRNAYNNGISNIPATATWIYRYTGFGDLKFANSTLALAMYYPNLILENTENVTYSSEINTSNIPFSNFTMAGSEPVIIKGNFDVGGNQTGNVNFSNIITSTTPVFIGGDLIVKSGSTLRNTGTNAPSPGTGFEIISNMEIEGILNLSAGTGAEKGILKLSGNEDMIGIGSGNIITNHILIDKDPGFNLFSGINLEVKESAQFYNGILELSDPSVLFTFYSTSAATGASNNSFIDGRVRKIADSGENFTFPIGDSNANGDFYQPARIFGNSTTTTIDAQYFIEEHPFAGAYYDGNSNSSDDNQEIGNCDYWTINKIGSPDTTSDVRIALTFVNADPDYCNVVGQPESMRIASLNAANIWDLTGSANSGSEIVMDVPINSAITGGSYGDFVFQSNAFNLNVLPINLLSFRAQPKGEKVELTWITSSETNNDFFTVERSANAFDFKVIGTIDGAGNTRITQTYTFDDAQPLPNVSYYRLKQTDYDGAFTFSDMKAVLFESPDDFSLELVYKNGNDLNLIYNSDSPTIYTEIFDVVGKLIFSSHLENYGGRSILPLNLTQGAYLVRISAEGYHDSEKFGW